MPNKYVRKPYSSRGAWSQDDLFNAMEAVQNGTHSVKRAAETFHIPRKTLERRLKVNNSIKGSMGPGSMFGKENEDRIVKHIKRMQKQGFPFSRDDVRILAFEFANRLGIKHRFNDTTEKAGYVWLNLFLSRHPDIAIRKAEGVSLARREAMNREEVDAYFKLIHDTMEENELFDKPANIFNMDESGLQLNNRPGLVLAEKGVKVVSTITSTEKGETITIIACCNAEGNFLPPACVMKGKNKKNEFEDGMPPGSVVYMSQKSAYINTPIFFQWLKDHFVPRKPPGKTLLLLDGHTSHTTSEDMLAFADSNNIILLSLPSHTTHYLQPLDRSVFKSVKNHFYNACRIWLKTHPGRRITRLQFGELLNETWGKSATPENAISGFKATGIYPFNPHVIPDYAFLTSSADQTNPEQTAVSSQETQDGLDQGSFETSAVESYKEAEEHFDPQPSTSKTCDIETPTKLLSDIAPVPNVTITVRKRAKQVAKVLTSPENIEKRRTCSSQKQRKLGKLPIAVKKSKVIISKNKKKT